MTAPEQADRHRARGASAAGAPRRLASAIAAVVLLSAAWLSLGRAAGAEAGPEHRVKAVFILHFAEFTEWPVNAFTNAEEPIVIGTLGTHPFGKLLEDAVRGEVVGGRTVTVQH